MIEAINVEQRVDTIDPVLSSVSAKWVFVSNISSQAQNSSSSNYPVVSNTNWKITLCSSRNLSALTVHTAERKLKESYVQTESPGTRKATPLSWHQKNGGDEQFLEHVSTLFCHLAQSFIVLSISQWNDIYIYMTRHTILLQGWWSTRWENTFPRTDQRHLHRNNINT
jgi:hypothetical protein